MKRWTRQVNLKKASLLAPGSLIRYYQDGWYNGYVDYMDGTSNAIWVEVRPIAGFSASRPRCIKVELDDIDLGDLGD